MKVKYIFVFFLLSLNLFLIWTFVFGKQGFLAYSDLHDEYDKLLKKVETQEKKNIELSREIRLLQTDEKYVEQMIRKRLNYVKDNEIWYLFKESPNSANEGMHETKN